MQGAGRDAEFAYHALAFIEVEFPVRGGHGQGAGKTDRHAVAAVDAFLLLKPDPLLEWFHLHIVAGEVGDSFFEVGGRPL